MIPVFDQMKRFGAGRSGPLRLSLAVRLIRRFEHYCRAGHHSYVSRDPAAKTQVTYTPSHSPEAARVLQKNPWSGCVWLTLMGECNSEYLLCWGLLKGWKQILPLGVYPGAELRQVFRDLTF